MKSWHERSPEVAYLLNPAFCARILYGTIREYKRECKRDFPVILLYLVLPIVLHKETRKKIKTRTHMKVWLQRNPELLIGYAKRAKSLIPITREAIEFLMKSGTVSFANEYIKIINLLKRPDTINFLDEEIEDCFSKAEAVGRWFARNGSVENIYQSWGVMP